MYFAGLVFPMRDDDPAFPALRLGDYVLGESTLSSRLGDRIRQKEGLSYGCGSNLNASAEDQRTALAIYAICNPVNIQKVRKGIGEEVDRLITKGIRPEELATAKEGYLQQEQLERTRDRNLVGMLAENLRTDRTMKYYADLEKRISELTSDEIVAAMRQHIDPKRLYVVTAGDFKRAETASGQ
jgi:zinc protease